MRENSKLFRKQTKQVEDIFSNYDEQFLKLVPYQNLWKSKRILYCIHCNYNLMNQWKNKPLNPNRYFKWANWKSPSSLKNRICCVEPDVNSHLESTENEFDDYAYHGPDVVRSGNRKNTDAGIHKSSEFAELNDLHELNWRIEIRMQLGMDNKIRLDA